MSYTALYRKFRPDRFEDVKGQEHIVSTLKNQITADRVGHAYLFCGTRGTGKTTVAKIFAKAVNCEHPVDGSPCGQCESCKTIAAGASMNVIEIDAASNNGVDNIREIREEVSYSPAEGKYKVYIIDEVHMLSIGAFNALLKTLEEPPSYVIFILATTEVHKIPVTILSRCQRYDFRRITIDTIAARMRELMGLEGVKAQDKALKFIAKMADGSMRDALSLLDQCLAFYFGQELTYDMALDVLGAVDTEVFGRMLKMVLARDVTGAVRLLEDIVMQGRELSQFVTDFTWYLRNLLLISTSQEGIEDIVDVSSENLARLREEAGMLSVDALMRYIRIFSEVSGQIKYSSQKRVLLEMTLIKLCKPEMETNYDSILERLRSLEERMEEGAFCQSGPASVGQGEFPPPAAAAERGEREKAPLPDALPEDVEEAVRNFRAVTGKMEPMFQNALRGAQLSVEGNRLLIVTDKKVTYTLFSEEVHRKELEDAIADHIHRRVETSVKMLKTGQVFDEEYPDIAKMINMDIEIEE